MEALDAIGSALVKVGEALGIPNLDPKSGLIFVTGGSGPIGHRVARRLLESGYPHVRLGSLHADHLQDMYTLGAEVADFRWDREETYENALAGVRSVLCTTPYCKNWSKHFHNFLKACKKAGVKHVVKLSFYHARVSGDVMQEVPLARAHGDCDELLSLMHFDRYTIIEASHFMSNPFMYQNKELRSDQKPAAFYGASHGKGVNYVSPNDVAEAAVRILLCPKDHKNKTYSLTGPEAITDNMVSQLLSKHLNKPIMYVDQPLHTFEDSEKMGGEPKWRIKDLVELEKIKASGNEESEHFLTKDFEKLCGHKPQTFEEYLNAKEYMTPVELP